MLDFQVQNNSWKILVDYLLTTNRSDHNNWLLDNPKIPLNVDGLFLIN